MNNVWVIILIVLMIVVGFIIGVMGTEMDDLRADAEVCQDQIDELGRKANDYELENSSLKTKLNEALQIIKALQKKVEDLEREVKYYRTNYGRGAREAEPAQIVISSPWLVINLSESDLRTILVFIAFNLAWMVVLIIVIARLSRTRSSA